MYVFQPDGRILAGWPQINPNGRSFSYQSPVLADIDNDDTLEIITAMHQNGGGVYVWRYNGTLLSGWPYTLSRWTYCPPSVADLYQNGDLKVICGVSGAMSAVDVLYAYDHYASVLSGFPIIMTSGDAAEGNITVADIDGDNQMEIIYTSNYMTTADSSGYLYAVNHDGTPLIGWPLRTHGFTYMNGATVADVDDDDSMDIIAVSAEGSVMQVSIWEAGVPYNRARWEYPTYHFDMARTGLYRPYQSGIEESSANRTYTRLAISPNPVSPGSNLFFNLNRAGNYDFTLYDKAGILRKHLFSGYLDSGKHQLTLPHDLTNGIYFLKQTINKTSNTYKLTITN
jgi:hypothetical protein